MFNRNVCHVGAGLQCVSSTNAIECEDTDQSREHVEDVVQAADPSVGEGLC
jgi:hypothetical protein